MDTTVELDPIVGLAVSTQDVAWVLVLAICSFVMVAPFVFWAIVMVTRRKEQLITEPVEIADDELDELAS